MGMRLNDPLVTSFIYEDTEYPINLAYDNVLDVFDVLDDKELRNYEKAEINLALLLDKEIHGEKAIDLWNFIYESFIHIETKKIIEYDRKGNPLPVQNEQKNPIDIEKDSEYIYSSFQQAYGMNLFKEQGKLHWSEFKALLSGLPSNTIMQRIIQIRLWKPSKGDSSEYKEAMKKLQKAYSIEDDEGEVDE